jgi:hypothetical protein
VARLQTILLSACDIKGETTGRAHHPATAVTRLHTLHLLLAAAVTGFQCLTARVQWPVADTALLRMCCAVQCQPCVFQAACSSGQGRVQGALRYR